MMTPKKFRFVEEFLIDLNAAAAARRAGYSQNAAASEGSRLLMDVDVSDAIQIAMEARQERTLISQDRVIEELARIAFGDQRKIASWNSDGVTLVDSALLTDAEAAMVAEVVETRTKDGGTMRVKFHDKIKALELLGKHLGMWKDKVELTGKDGTPIALAEIPNFGDIYG